MNFLLVERKGKKLNEFFIGWKGKEGKLNTKTTLANLQVHASIPGDSSPCIPS